MKPKRSILIIIIVMFILAVGSAIPTGAFGNSEHLVGSKIGAYTTYYSTSSPERKHNIRLAANALNSVLVLPRQTISFNELVGERTATRGYQSAHIILDGEFTDGVGGGVCQVSSTLYNAWATSGLEVIRAANHSIPVSYVPLSRDAAVSSVMDLVLKNNSISSVFISATCENDAISIRLYGKSDGYEYNLISETLSELIPPSPEFINDDTLPIGTIKTLREPRAGYQSRTILQTLKHGKVISTKVYRVNTYPAVNARILVNAPPLP